MPQFLEVKPGDPQKAAQHMATQRPPIEPNRSIDMNATVDLTKDDDDEPAKASATPNTGEGEVQEGDDTSTTSASDNAEGLENSQDGKKNEEESAETDFNFDVKLGEDDEEEKPASQQTADGQHPAGPRKYEEYPESLRPILKSLNNTLFAKFAPELKRLHERAAAADELKKQLDAKPDNYRFHYEHPEAYRLDQGYMQREMEVQYGQWELNHYMAELAKIERGQPWKSIGYDKDGNPTYTTIAAPGEGKVDIENKIRVQDHINRLGAELTNAKSQQNAYRQNYTQASKRSIEELATLRKRLFPNFADDSVQLQGAEKSWYEMAVNALPIFSSHPLMRQIIGPMAVTAYRLKMRNKTQSQEIRQLKAKLEDRKLIDPPVNGGGFAQKRGQKPVIRTRQGKAINPDDVVDFSKDD